jgi:hypothetical protein
MGGLLTEGEQPQLTPGAQRIFGEWTPTTVRGLMPGKDATDANAALQQVMGQQIIDLIAEMKSQSQTGATGFGQMTIRELDVLQSAATQLTRRLSHEGALKELLKIRSALLKVIAEPQSQGTAAAGSPAGRVRATRDANGRLVIQR